MIEARRSPGRGRGVFARRAIAAGTEIERAPVVVSPGAEWPSLRRTALHDYTFTWGPRGEDAAVAMGLVSLCNHSFEPNAVYRKRLRERLVVLVALRAIAPGEEITVNYNGDPGDRTPPWFVGDGNRAPRQRGAAGSPPSRSA